MIFDVAIVGAGPAGATAAAHCAAAGLRTLLLERARFPREKVCGDCLNPACWPLLDRLDLTTRLRTLPHSALESVEFIGLNGSAFRVPLAPSLRGEIAIKRSALDALLLDRARELGAHILEDHAVEKIQPGWKLHTAAASFEARTLFAADGRNSSVARLLNLLPAAARDRIGLQTHVPSPAGFGHRVSLRFLPQGYCGVASVGGDELNVCVVASPQNLAALKSWAANFYQMPADQAWRTIAPLARSPVAPLQENLLLLGDAARVVEPFTGEGIYYAMATGELAARHLIAGDTAGYAKAHARLYRGRLWINELTRFAVTQPRVATALLAAGRIAPGILRLLTRKVIGPSAAGR